MYISIHRKEVRFLHKHESLLTICNLDFIAARGQHVDVTHIGASSFLRDLTETELQRLYRNTTGQTEDSAHHGDALRGVLGALAERFPVTDCNTYEADQQAAYLEKTYPDGHGAFQYRRGHLRAAEASDQPVRPTVAALTAEEAAIAARKRAAFAPLPAPASPAATGAAPAPQPVRVVVQARREGKTSAVIFEAADKLWEEAGKPTDMPSVLAVRKKVMDQLEKVGIKRTTCSSTLGAWQKARI